MCLTSNNDVFDVKQFLWHKNSFDVKKIWMKKCVDSGLWNPSGGGSDNEVFENEAEAERLAREQDPLD